MEEYFIILPVTVTWTVSYSFRAIKWICEIPGLGIWLWLLLVGVKMFLWTKGAPSWESFGTTALKVYWCQTLKNLIIACEFPVNIREKIYLTRKSVVLVKRHIDKNPLTLCVCVSVRARNTHRHTCCPMLIHTSGPYCIEFRCYRSPCSCLHQCQPSAIRKIKCCWGAFAGSFDAHMIHEKCCELEVG